MLSLEEEQHAHAVALPLSETSARITDKTTPPGNFQSSSVDGRGESRLVGGGDMGTDRYHAEITVNGVNEQRGGEIVPRQQEAASKLLSSSFSSKKDTSNQEVPPQQQFDGVVPTINMARRGGTWYAVPDDEKVMADVAPHSSAPAALLYDRRDEQQGKKDDDVPSSPMKHAPSSPHPPSKTKARNRTDHGATTRRIAPENHVVDTSRCIPSASSSFFDWAASTFLGYDDEAGNSGFYFGVFKSSSGSSQQKKKKARVVPLVSAAFSMPQPPCFAAEGDIERDVEVPPTDDIVASIDEADATAIHHHGHGVAHTRYS
jgi:hypothetical protein